MDIEKISKISKEKRNRMISAMQERYRLMQKGYEMERYRKSDTASMKDVHIIRRVEIEEKKTRQAYRKE